MKIVFNSCNCTTPLGQLKPGDLFFFRNETHSTDRIKMKLSPNSFLSENSYTYLADGTVYNGKNTVTDNTSVVKINGTLTLGNF